MLCSVDNSLTGIFRGMITNEKNLKTVESVACEEGKGISAWVDGGRVLIGNRGLLLAHGVAVPPIEVEAGFTAEGKELLYLSNFGSLSAGFVISYHADKQLRTQLRELEKVGIALMVHTTDPNITPARVAQVYGLQEENIHMVPAALQREAEAALDGVRDLGLAALGGGAGFDLLRARLKVARAERPDLPDPDEAALLASAGDWLGPWLSAVRSAADLRALDPTPALLQSIGHDGRAALDRLAPAAYRTPLGRLVPIDYGGAAPEIALRLQELFGETRHPSVAGQPLRVTLLSPAGRPVQTTMDLPGFWAGSYADVRKDMRARYPRHPWPEDPTRAEATLRAKPRGT